jgi:hypothetical protein
MGYRPRTASIPAIPKQEKQFRDRLVTTLVLILTLVLVSGVLTLVFTT